ncbi:hypothetical protein D8674_013860 [Pyrus ussuriensis x Pyrus communis]|uniref:Uncharacterized protein n=1 Tax=Pyrus ussuriensis x Pyrus communis TaxID=2448454 RepID=A0A5N5GVQ4_9ROSA|nr:hypothetical protein D8674_013860 [Pyrus ussuriensis x Pyrus communis]
MSPLGSTWLSLGELIPYCHVMGRSPWPRAMMVDGIGDIASQVEPDSRDGYEDRLRLAIESSSEEDKGQKETGLDLQSNHLMRLVCDQIFGMRALIL